MKTTPQVDISKIDLIVFDFDGVLTNNKVYLNSQGDEFVQCSRSDGLAFDALRQLNIESIILSSEKNNVVSARGAKLNVNVIHGISNKHEKLKEYAELNNIDLARVIFVGNDLNDYTAMESCGYAFCPSDSHSTIKKHFPTLPLEGGQGVARYLVEHVLGFDLLKLFQE